MLLIYSISGSLYSTGTALIDQQLILCKSIRETDYARFDACIDRCQREVSV